MIFGINTITVVRDAIVCMIMMMVICFSNFTSDSSSALFGRALRFQHLQKSKTISDYSSWQISPLKRRQNKGIQLGRALDWTDYTCA